MNHKRTESQPRRERGIFERPIGSGAWWVRYHDEHGREHREKVGQKSLALKVYQKRKNEIQERRFFPERIRRKDVLLATMIDDYLDRNRDRLRWFDHYERFGKFWKDALGAKTLREIVPGDIDRYVVKRRGARRAKPRKKDTPLTPATINRELAFLKRVFNVAILDGKADTNPVRAVRFLKENNARVRYLSDDEDRSLREAIGEADWPMLDVAVHTGLRQSEQFELRWEHVDFAAGIITIPRAKHGEARRVPMNDTVRGILRTQQSRLKSSYVFPSQTGETSRDVHNYAARVFRPAIAAAGIENFHWHDLRHTFASRLVMAGVDLRTVQELMGHKTITMTVRYAHLSPAHQLEAVQRLNRLPNPAPTGTTTGTSAPAAEVTRQTAGRKAPPSHQKKKWAESELNTRHRDFQSLALPTELPARP